ncbi:MAG: type II toxin-antitoxin system RelE/ParE family toxin [Myxococcales bacterium]|nr:MAG: type II toxin-antitoxin system RelE/ParE family toxin [Myxococcales bacterium]
MLWTVVRYRRANGETPFDEFMEGLVPKDKARVVRTVELLETFGPRLTEPYAKKIQGSELWELRVPSGSNAFRVFYVAWTGRTFVLFNGFRKKTQKTPLKELARAQRLLSEMKEREKTR